MTVIDFYLSHMKLHLTGSTQMASDGSARGPRRLCAGWEQSVHTCQPPAGRDHGLLGIIELQIITWSEVTLVAHTERNGSFHTSLQSALLFVVQESKFK